jgi:hypothetical protein
LKSGPFWCFKKCRTTVKRDFLRQRWSFTGRKSEERELPSGAGIDRCGCDGAGRSRLGRWTRARSAGCDGKQGSSDRSGGCKADRPAQLRGAKLPRPRLALHNVAQGRAGGDGERPERGRVHRPRAHRWPRKPCKRNLHVRPDRWVEHGTLHSAQHVIGHGAELRHHADGSPKQGLRHAVDQELER